MSKALDYLAISKKAGYLILGEEATGFAARGGTAKILFVASDSSDNARRRVKGFAAAGGEIPLVTVPFTKKEISERTGKPGCSMGAITDLGLASSFIDALFNDDPETYQEASDIIKDRYERLQRKKNSGKNRNGNKDKGKRRTNI